MNLTAGRHLQDDALYDAYLTAHRGAPPNPPAAEHLADCPACARRYSELAALMDDLSRAADADLEQFFPPERRRLQQQHILDRIERLGRPARVLSFPARGVARRLGAAAPRIATRWIAAAAAAGLFVGLGVGVFFDDSRLPDSTSVRREGPLAVTATRRPNPGFNSEADEEAFLSDLDAALQSPRTRVLLGYDALTPHVRDVVDIR